MLCPLYCLMHFDPLPVFARYLRVIPSGPMLFCALREIADGIGGCTGFIYRIISWWDAIRWEGEMFHYLSEVNLGFAHFRCDWLEGFQGDAARYWFIISGVHDLGADNAIWSVVGGWRGIPGGWAIFYSITCINWFVIFVVGVAPVSGALLWDACSCVSCIRSHGCIWAGEGLL